MWHPWVFLKLIMKFVRVFDKLVIVLHGSTFVPELLHAHHMGGSDNGYDVSFFKLVQGLQKLREK